MTDLAPVRAYVARQPILDRARTVYGYELLYRNSDENRAIFDDADRATASCVVSAFLDIGIDQLVGDRRAFVNLSRGILLGDAPVGLDPEQVVLELIETIQVDDAVIQRVTELRELGYQIALDDFVYSEQWQPILEMAYIVKLDVDALSAEELERQVELLRPYRARLLAEKVETNEQFEMCRELGFELFQGYFFCRPEIVRNRKLSSNNVATLRLLATLFNPEAGLQDIEKAISTDVALTYRLLRYLNSAAFRRRAPIESVRQALVMLGLVKTRAWASLLALADVSDKPTELTSMALVRARTCELFAQEQGKSNPDSFFVVGLFSLLDSMMSLDMDSLLDELPLAEPVRDALLGRDGELGDALKCAVAYEGGEDSSVDISTADCVAAQTSYVLAIEWANQTMETIKGVSKGAPRANRARGRSVRQRQRARRR